MSLAIDLWDKEPEYDDTNWDAVNGAVSLYEWHGLTHNLGKMADAVGLYYPMWRPEEINCTEARDISGMLKIGMIYMIENKEKLEKLNPENGWGDYNGLLRCVIDYYQACLKYPKAIIKVNR